jgi:hypothetical protein
VCERPQAKRTTGRDRFWELAHIIEIPHEATGAVIAKRRFSLGNNPGTLLDGHRAHQVAHRDNLTEREIGHIQPLLHQRVQNVLVLQAGAPCPRWKARRGMNR